MISVGYMACICIICILFMILYIVVFQKRELNDVDDGTQSSMLDFIKKEGDSPESSSAPPARGKGRSRGARGGGGRGARGGVGGVGRGGTSAAGNNCNEDLFTL